MKKRRQPFEKGPPVVPTFTYRFATDFHTLETFMLTGIFYDHFNQTSPASPPDGSAVSTQVFLMLPYAPPMLEPDPLKKYGAAVIRSVLEAEDRVIAPAAVITNCADPAEITNPPDTTSKLALSTPPDLNLMLSIVLDVVIPMPVPEAKLVDVKVEAVIVPPLIVGDVIDIAAVIVPAVI